jgi:hypothetical protein
MKRPAPDEERNLELVAQLIGPETLLAGVNSNLIADAAARRARMPVIRRQRVNGKLVMAPTEHMPAGATINRQFPAYPRNFAAGQEGLGRSC